MSITVAVDANGADLGPSEVAEGAAEAAAHGVRVLLFGPADEILSGLDEGRLVATSTTPNLADGDVVAPQVERLTASVKSE